MATPPAMRRWGWGLRRRLDRGQGGALPCPVVPGPCGTPWVSGALQLRHDPLRVLLDAAHGGGAVVALGRWPRPLYLVNHPTLIQSILEHPAHYTKRPSITRITPLGLDHGVGHLVSMTATDNP